jgi:chaperonin GroEL
MQFDRGYLSLFRDQRREMLANSRTRTFSSEEAFLAAALCLSRGSWQAKPLLIIAEDIEGEAWRRWSSTSCAAA